MLKRFGSVTVLNGHIHQVMQKVEGNVMFHTAMSTAFPQPAPGAAPSPGPMKVSADRLQSVLGITDVKFVAQRRELAIVDATLSGMTGQYRRVGLLIMRRMIFVSAFSILASGCLAFLHPWGELHNENAGLAILSGSEIPAEVRGILDKKCADCHSNQTRWPPYSRVAPTSWLLEHDVYAGRSALNFSAWEIWAQKTGSLRWPASPPK